MDGNLVKNHKVIIARYAKSGWLLFDALGTFPFQLIPSNNIIAIKLIRMLRLPRIMRVLNEKRFKNTLGSLFNQSGTRSEKIRKKVYFKKVYQMTRLIMITVVLVYFIGVIFYFISLFGLQAVNSFNIFRDESNVFENTFLSFFQSEESNF